MANGKLSVLKKKALLDALNDSAMWLGFIKTNAFNYETSTEANITKATEVARKNIASSFGAAASNSGTVVTLANNGAVSSNAASGAVTLKGWYIATAETGGDIICMQNFDSDFALGSGLAAQFAIGDLTIVMD